jgi:tRNA(Ile)-lysidine synthase
MCLLQILKDLQSKWGWRFALAHCDHRWPLDSQQNADYVAELARQWQLECFRFTAPVPLTGEAEGRAWRYQVLSRLAQDYEFSAVLTAHTASDRAETLLYNLLRGSGMDGLQALGWERPLADRVQLIRPLLAVTRQQTADFCQQLGLPVWQDAMNQDLTYRRNQIRLELLPWLNRQFNPQVETTLAKTAEILQAETDYLHAQSLNLLEQCSSPEASFEGLIAALNQSVLQNSPLALQRRVLRRWINIHLGIQPNFEQVEKTVALIHGNPGDRSDPFVAGAIAEVKSSWLCLVRLNPSDL